MKKSYSEQLRDPRWQRKRLEVLEAAGWTCKQCGEKSKQLQVHHMYYKRGASPWEYPEEALVVLCEDCHDFVASLQEFLAEAIARRCAPYQSVGDELSNIIAFIANLPSYPMNYHDGKAAAMHVCSFVEWVKTSLRVDDKGVVS